MKRNVFRTKNQLAMTRYIYFTVTLAVMLVIFLIIGNLGVIASIYDLEEWTKEEREYVTFDSLSVDIRIEKLENREYAEVVGDNAPIITLYDPENDNTMIRTQLYMSRQEYSDITSISEAKYSDLLIVDCENISAEETKALVQLADNGVSILFSKIPSVESLGNEKLKALLGIEHLGDVTTWPGIRTSSDLLCGTLVEKPRYKVTGIDVQLGENVKIYACALPNKYWTYENEDLPPVIWRYIEGEGVGRVYVFNGDFMNSEMGYGILPVVLSEICDNYIYPIINAYCLTVSGYPYAENESSENWARLYSRDKLQIAQDMISSQLKRYSGIYGARITYFSRDYDEMTESPDKNMTYFNNEIASGRGMLAKLDGDTYSLGNDSYGTKIVDWSSDFKFVDEEDGTLNLPIIFHSTTSTPQVEEYKIAALSATLGFFCADIDYDEFLRYDGEDDIWNLYCNKQEVMLGTHQRDYGWLERVTMREAMGRLYQLLTMDLKLTYNEKNIFVYVKALSDETWFILRSDNENITIDNGTIEEVGSNCYFVTVWGNNAIISWGE